MPPLAAPAPPRRRPGAWPLLLLLLPVLLLSLSGGGAPQRVVGWLSTHHVASWLPRCTLLPSFAAADAEAKWLVDGARSAPPLNDRPPAAPQGAWDSLPLGPFRYVVPFALSLLGLLSARTWWASHADADEPATTLLSVVAQTEAEGDSGHRLLVARLMGLGLRPRMPHHTQSLQWDFDIVPTASVSPKEPSSIKTLLYEYTPEEGARPLPLVVVLSNMDSLHVRNLVQVLRHPAETQRPVLQFMEPAAAAAHVGFPVGCLPPLGHTRPARLLLDTALVAALPRDAHLYGGGGELGFTLCLRVGALLDQLWVHPAPVSRSAAAALSVAIAADFQSLPPSPSANTHTPADQFATALLGAAAPATAPLPFDEGAEACHVVGVVASKRRMAADLAFCTVVPPPAGPVGRPVRNQPMSESRRWRRPDGTYVALQLILGRTLQDRLGVADAIDRIRAVKPGRLVYASGRLNTHRSEASLKNLQTRRTYDVAVADIQVLELPVRVRVPVPAPDSSDGSPAETVAVLELSEGAAGGMLTLEDVGQPSVTFIDSAEQLGSLVTLLAEGRASGGLVGLDSEWLAAGDTPVALLQLAFPTGVAVLDLLALCRPRLPPTSPLTAAEASLDALLAVLFGDPDLFVVGFGVAVDLQRLSHSYPHLPCFQLFAQVVELEAVLKTASQDAGVGPGAVIRRGRSLSDLCQALLQRRLDKTLQCSRWDRRPLTAAQLQYAALDAAVLPVLLRRLTGGDPRPWLRDRHPELVLEWIAPSFLAPTASPPAAR
eukprot:EG_transcript_3851